MTSTRAASLEELKRLVVIVVTYNSDVSKVVSNLRYLRDASISVIVADNSTDRGVRELLAEAARRNDFNYICNGDNLGIGEAQNRGVFRARELGYEYVLFLDDDSAISATAVSELLAVFKSVGDGKTPVAAVGPLIRDARSQEALVFVWKNWRLLRFSGPYAERPIEVAFMLSSGTLTSLERLAVLGDFRSEYFIDHIDLEWGLRAGSRGFKLLVVPTAPMTHSLADDVSDSKGRTPRRYTHTNPIRNYYQVRNLVLLLKDVDLPAMRRVGLLLRMVRDILRMTRSTGAGRKVRFQLRGLAHGVLNKRGDLRLRG